MRRDPAEPEGDDLGADAVDIERYIATLRRNAALIATIVVVITGGVTVASLLVPKSYDATTDVIVLDRDVVTSESSDADSARRRLATLRALVTARPVLASAAEHLGVDAEALEDRVSANSDDDANLLAISAVGASGKAAQRTANAVARSFVEQQSRTQRERLRTVIDRISRETEQLREAGAKPDSEKVSALEERRAELLAAEAAVGLDLQVARAADLPEAASAPHPIRNALLAFAASLFVAVLVALARGQLRPRPTARELSQLVGPAILTKLPDSEGRVARRGTRADGAAAYRTLAALLRLTLPPVRRHSVLVTSMVHGEGRTTAVRRLGASLAEAGHRTLVVSADLRRPDLDALYGVQGSPGLCDVLVGSRGTGMADASIGQVIVAPEDGRARTPDILPSGSRGVDPTGEVAVAAGMRETLALDTLLDPSAIRAVLDAIAELGYTYVLLDGPPALGDVPDAALLATACDQVLVVARLARISASDAIDLRERLDHIAARPVGLAVIDPDAPVSSPYELAARGASAQLSRESVRP